MHGHADQTYQERQAVGHNVGELFFEDWCRRKGWNYYRIGFDEKHGNVNSFFNLAPVIRNLPDYVIERDGKTFVVNVKGTTSLKESERLLLPDLIMAFSSPRAKLIYAFCIKNHSVDHQDRFVKFAEADVVMDLYDRAEDKTWDDGKIYRTLDLSLLNY